MADPRQEFLNVAMSHMGEGGSWAWSTSGLSSGQPWCAAFVIACAKTVGGMLGKVLCDGIFMAGYLVEASVQKKYGTYQLGGHNGGNPSPAAGDLVTFNFGSPTSGSGYFQAQHIGIVYSVNGSTVTTVEGNKSSKVGSRTLQANSSEVAVFYRPNWASIGGSTAGNVGDVLLTSDGTSASSGYLVGGDLYDTITTRADSIIREVGYWSSNKPTTESSKIRCSVINYTTQLGSFMKGAIGSGSYLSGTANTSVSIDGATSTNMRAVMESLLACGYTAAATAGICGNIQQESNYNPGAIGKSTHVTGYGLCQWSDDTRTTMRNGTNMINWVGSDWATNITKQIQYLDYQLQTDSYFGTLRVDMNSCPNTLEGAYQAMEMFLRQFEQPGNYDTEIARRKPYTQTAWNAMVIQV